jgi:hypothetical protein
MVRFFLLALLSLAPTVLAQEAVPPTQAREPIETSLRRSLESLPNFEANVAAPVPQVLVEEVAQSQPQSGDFLLSLAKDDKSALQRRAVDVIVASWQSMSAAQITAYLSDAIRPYVNLRPRYPEGFNVYARLGFETRYGWGGIPREGLDLRTLSTYFLDGKPYSAPYEYNGSPGATTGWLETGKLAPGEHHASIEMSFSFEHGGQRHSGRIKSPPFPFAIVDADLPDDLESAKSPEDEAAVKAAFGVSEPEIATGIAVREPPVPGQEAVERDPWAPQVTWRDGEGQTHGLRTPAWNLKLKLPFALCFEVEVHDKQSGRVYRGSPLSVPAGKSYGGYFMLDATNGFARDRAGLVPVKVVLQPSYALALSDPDIKSFYAGRLEFDNLHIKIVRPAGFQAGGGAQIRP